MNKYADTLPKYSCQLVCAKAYTKLDRIFDMLDMTPISESSIFNVCENTPTENMVPIRPVSMLYVENRLNWTALKLNWYRVNR